MQIHVQLENVQIIFTFVRINSHPPVKVGKLNLTHTFINVIFY